ncbi:MAG: 4Fe-4S binding protein, partial [Moorellaceae bacterium]
MRKIVLVALLFAFALLWSPGEALACTLNLTPSTFNVAAGETVTFHLERTPTHRQCVLPLEETKILVSGGKLIDPGVWKKGAPDVLDFKVAFEQPGQAVVRVERNCPKSGLIAVEARGTVVAASKSTAPQTTARAPETKPFNTVAPPATSKSGQDSLPVHPPETTAPPVTAPETRATGENVHPPETAAPPTEEQNDSSNPWWLTSSINLRLWFAFLTIGLIAYLLKLTRYRKPLLFVSVILLGFYLGGCPEPVGAPFYLLSRNPALFGTALILLALPLALSLIWGRVFCGWVCPLGATQEFIHAGQAWGKGSYRVPAPVDKALKQLKFVVLAVFGYLSWQTSHNAFSNYDPFKVLFNF